MSFGMKTNFTYLFAISLCLIFVSKLSLASGIELECKFTNYLSSGYREDIVKTWIPENQTHLIEGTQAIWKQFRNDGTGKIKKDNSKRVEFEYTIDMKMDRGAVEPTTYKFIYFRTNNKIVVKVNWHAGWRPIDSVWGKCNSSNINLSKNNSDLQINDEENFVNVGGDNIKDIFVNKSTSEIKIINDAKHFRKLFSILSNDNNPSVNIAVYFTNDPSWEFKKYKLKYIPTDRIRLSKDQGMKIMYIKSAEMAESLINPNKRYFTISVENAGRSEYYWFATNDLKASCFNTNC